jgi:hypothetical protein
MNGASQKDHAHELIERLPDSEIGTAVRFLEFMLLDPVARALATAPPDDEPVTEQDRAPFQSGKETPMDVVLAEFGLKPEDLPD